MNRAQAKRIILGQLCSYLKREVQIDGVDSEKDLAVMEAAQNELIAEFSRRAGNAVYEDRWDV